MNLNKAHIKVWWGAVKYFKLSTSETLLIFLIYGLSRQKGYCYASKSALSKIMNVSQPTIFYNLKKLEDKGLIEKLGQYTQKGVNKIKPSKQFEKLIKLLHDKDPDSEYELFIEEGVLEEDDNVENY